MPVQSDIGNLSACCIEIVARICVVSTDALGSGLGQTYIAIATCEKSKVTTRPLVIQRLHLARRRLKPIMWTYYWKLWGVELIKVSFQDELMRLDGALARTGTRCKSTGKGGHRTWLSCFTRLGNSQGSKLKSISYKIRLSRESLQVRNDLVGAIGYWARADSALAGRFDA